MGIWYCSRDDVKRAIDYKETARNNEQIDRAIESASRLIEGRLHRKFFPEVRTKFFDWPNFQYARPWRLWFDEDEVISITELRTAGLVIDPSDFFLEPANQGPPFNRVDLNIDGPANFGTADTFQRSVEIDGVFGFDLNEEVRGELASDIDATTTTVQVTDGRISVGHLIRVDTERMNVVEKSATDSGQTLQTAVTAKLSEVTISVSDGTQFFPQEEILINGEKMLIVDIAGNNLIVKRNWDGLPLQDHSLGAQIFAFRTLTVERGVLGTTAASHLATDTVQRHIFPGGVRALCVAQAEDTVLQELGGYSRETGARVQQQGAKGVGLADLWTEVYGTYGRKARIRGV